MDKDTLTSKDNSKLSFFEAFQAVIFAFPKRSKDIIIMRYGLNKEEPKTLEEIGKYYKITRERVRQIIREALAKVRKKGNFDPALRIKQKLEFTIKENNGIIKEKDILDRLGGKDGRERGAIEFFLDCFDEITRKEIKEEMEKSLALSDFDLVSWREMKNNAMDILKKTGSPVVIRVLIDKLAEKEKGVSEQKAVNCLSISREIKQNAFGKWGLAQWPEISPRKIRDKARLILKEEGKPLHFKEIASLIDKKGLGKKSKTAHPQTVHNELIRDNQFVLVGRGIYALSEWGYKKGTVKDVVEEILKKSSKPLDKEEILGKVLKIRQVKESTVVINLNNFFVKTNKGKYTVKKQN